MDKKSDNTEKKPAKAKEPKMLSPKGALPRKQRGKTTGGTIDGTRRYCPSKRIKSMHRKSESDLSLRAFAASLKEGSFRDGARDVVSDWLANKSASGRGY